ncbi:hypothetical protein LNO88_12165 [Klebsiella pneumoniae subsp. pneumoniae]|nr:hypothetical protein [Klebsiella pneumoniae subsp. pneumoniae]
MRAATPLTQALLGLGEKSVSALARHGRDVRAMARRGFSAARPVVPGRSDRRRMVSADTCSSATSSLMLS